MSNNAPPELLPDVLVPAGKLDPHLRAKIEEGVTALVPEGKRFAVLGLYDLAGNQVDIQLAVKVKDHFKLVVNTQWDGQLTGYVGVVASF